MDNIQANSARFIYTLTPCPPKKTSIVSTTSIKSKNAFLNHLSKEDLFKLLKRRKERADKLKRSLYFTINSKNHKDTDIYQYNENLKHSNVYNGDDDDDDGENFKSVIVRTVKRKRKHRKYRNGNKDDDNDDDGNDNDEKEDDDDDEDDESIDNDNLKTEYSRLLSNGFCFSKQARSDEKIRFSEQDMFGVVRTVTFIHVFNVTTEFSILDIINSGKAFFFFRNAFTDELVRNDNDDLYDYDSGDEISKTDDYKTYYSLNHLMKTLNLPNKETMDRATFQTMAVKNDLAVNDIVHLLDRLFGKNFATIVRRPISKVYEEYMTVWRYFPFCNPTVPSASDLLKLHRFVNTSIPFYTKTTQFVLRNSLDNKIPLQSTIKHLNNHAAV